MSLDAMKQALEALEHIQRCIGLGTATIHYGSSTWEQSDQAITALRERLAQPDQWQGLTDDDIAQAMYRADAIITGSMQFKFARQIEAKLKEKNHV